MEEYLASKADAKEKDNDLFYSAKNNMTQAHLKYVTFAIYRQRCQDAQFADQNISKLMDLVGKVFILQELLEDGSALFDSGFIASGSFRNAQKAFEQCVAELRPQLIPLAEAMPLSESLSPSVIGNEYGDIYEQQLECAMKTRLNINNEVPSYFERLMKPVLRPKL